MAVSVPIEWFSAGLVVDDGDGDGDDDDDDGDDDSHRRAMRAGPAIVGVVRGTAARTLDRRAAERAIMAALGFCFV